MVHTDFHWPLPIFATKDNQNSDKSKYYLIQKFKNTKTKNINC